MSKQEIRRRRLCSYVAREAWRLYRGSGGITKAEAFRIAWMRLKCQLRVGRCRVAGVSQEPRQAALRRCAALQREEVRLALFRDSHNLYDKNAVAVLAAVGRRPPVQLGYLPRPIAREIADALDQNRRVLAWFGSVVGQRIPGGTLGCRIHFVVL